MGLERNTAGVHTTTCQIPRTFVDHYGHVNYKFFQSIAEEGQDAYLAARGLTFKQIEKDFGVKSVVRAYQQVNNSPAFAADILDILTRISRIGDTSFSFEQSALRGEVNIFDFKLTVVTAIIEGGQIKPVRVPDLLREQLISTQSWA